MARDRDIITINR